VGKIKHHKQSNGTLATSMTTTALSWHLTKLMVMVKLACNGIISFRDQHWHGGHMAIQN